MRGYGVRTVDRGQAASEVDVGGPVVFLSLLLERVVRCTCVRHSRDGTGVLSCSVRGVVYLTSRSPSFADTGSVHCHRVILGAWNEL